MSITTTTLVDALIADDEVGDWTLGCIAVSNQAVEELWLLTRNGTPVVIEP